MNTSQPPASAVPANTFTADYPSLFGDPSADYCLPEALESSLGPTAYADALYGYARDLERWHDTTPYSPLNRRRPDIGQLLLDEPTLTKRVSRQSLVIAMLEAMVQETGNGEREFNEMLSEASGVDVTAMTPAATAVELLAGAQLPFDHSWELARQLFKYKHLAPWDVLRGIDRDFPGFAYGDVHFASMRDALTLCARLSPTQLKILIDEPSDAMDARLRERFGLTESVTVDSLADSETFLHATEINRKGLRQMLALNGVAVDASNDTPTSVTISATGHPGAAPDSATYGASFINDGTGPALRLARATSDGKKATRIEGLTASHLDRIGRLLRLHVGMKLPFASVDRLLQACFAAQKHPTGARIDINVIRTLGLFRHLHDNRRVDVDTYAAVIHAISPYATGRETPYYDRLFGARAGDAALVMDGGTFTATIDDPTMERLAAGLAVDIGTLSEFMAWVVEVRHLKAPVRDLSIVSACHRLAVLPRWLGLSAGEAVAQWRLFRVAQPKLFERLAGEPSLDAEATANRAATHAADGDTVDAIVTFINMREWLRQHRLDPDMVRALLGDITVPSTLVDATVAAISSRVATDGTGLLTDRDFEVAFVDMPFADDASPEARKPLAVLSSLVSSPGVLSDDLLDTKSTDGWTKRIETELRKAARTSKDNIQAVKDDASLSGVVAKVADVLRKARNTQSARVSEILTSLMPDTRNAALRESVRRWAGVTRENVLALQAVLPDRTKACAVTSALHRRASTAAALGLPFADIDALLANPAAFGVQKSATDASLRDVDLVFIHRMTEWNLVVSEAARRSLKTPEEAATALLAWVAGDRATDKLAQVLGIDRRLIKVGGAAPSVVPDIAWLMRLLVVAEASGLSPEALHSFSCLHAQSPADAIDSAARKLLASCSKADQRGILRWHNDRWRDAMVGWLLRHARDADGESFANRNALSDWLLTDLDVGPEPETTRLGAAIDSLQLYIHRLLSGLEKHLDAPEKLKARRKLWTAYRSRYSDWRAWKERRLYPENHIDPARRERKTRAFTDVEMQLAQGQARPSDIETTLLAYLATFERLSNIQVVSAYHDGIDPATDRLHLIGRSNVEPAEYFWRTADMSVKAAGGQTSMLAWGDWERIDLPRQGEVVRTKLAKLAKPARPGDSPFKQLEDDETTAKKNRDEANAASVTAADKAETLRKHNEASSVSDADLKLFSDAVTAAQTAEAALHDANNKLDAATNKLRLKQLEEGDPRSDLELVRPLIIHGRQYVVWAERDTSAIIFDDEDRSSPFYVTRVCYAYRASDGNWSPSNVLITLDGRTSDGNRKKPAAVKTTHGICDSRANLVTREYSPALVAMENRKGRRANDPLLVVLLYDGVSDKTLGRVVSADVDASANADDKRRTAGDVAFYFLAVRDLLLIDDRKLDDAGGTDYEARLVARWRTLYGDPRVVQHPYIGARYALRAATEGEAPALDKDVHDRLRKTRGMLRPESARLHASLVDEGRQIEVNAEVDDVWWARSQSSGTREVKTFDDMESLEVDYKGDLRATITTEYESGKSVKEEDFSLRISMIVDAKNLDQWKNGNQVRCRVELIFGKSYNGNFIQRNLSPTGNFTENKKNERYFIIVLASLKTHTTNSRYSDVDDVAPYVEPSRLDIELATEKVTGFETNWDIDGRIRPIVSKRIALSFNQSLGGSNGGKLDKERYFDKTILSVPVKLTAKPLEENVTQKARLEDLAAKAKIFLTKEKSTEGKISDNSRLKSRLEELKLSPLYEIITRSDEEVAAWSCVLDNENWFLSAGDFERTLRDREVALRTNGVEALEASVPFRQALQSTDDKKLHNAWSKLIATGLGGELDVSARKALSTQLRDEIVAAATANHSSYRTMVAQLRQVTAGKSPRIELLSEPMNMARRSTKRVAMRLPVDPDRKSYTFRLELSATDDFSNNGTPLTWLTLERTYTLEDIGSAGTELPDDRVASSYVWHNQAQAQYLDRYESKLPPVRLNTLFGKQLVARAARSVDAVLSIDTQTLPEPALRPEDGDGFVDFRGANGLYFWELFFHVPWLVAWNLRETRQYEEAWQWCSHYLFDPYRGRATTSTAPLPFWNALPLVYPFSVAEDTGTAPELAGYASHVYFRKALHNFVVETWRMQGDEQFRRLTPESVREAWLSYQRALRLIGPLQEPAEARPWQPVTLDSRNAAFTPPVNTRLREMQALLLSRLENLRHGRTIDGGIVPYLGYGHENGPSFGSGRKDLDGALSLLRMSNTPHYRFKEVIAMASTAVERLTGLGRYLFQIYEHEAENAFEVEQQKTLMALSDFDVSLKRQAIETMTKEHFTLEANRRSVSKRAAFYAGQIDTGINALETGGLTMGYTAVSLLYATFVPMLVRGGLKTIPRIWGMAVGGQEVDGPVAAAADGIKTTAEATRLLAEDLRTHSEYVRREQEWTLQKELADADLAILDAQAEELASRQTAAARELEQSIAQRDRLRIEYNVQTTGFAIADTYTWMLGRLGDLFASAYDSVLSLCMDAESAYRFETGDIDSRHVRTDAWDNAWRGMFAGEALQNDLNAMQRAYLHSNERRPLIHKDVSLKALLGKDVFDKALKANRLWVDLTADLFDRDYLGHYLRQLRHVSVDIKPTADAKNLRGDTAVRAVLTQRANTLLYRPDIDGVKWLKKPIGDPPHSILRNVRSNQALLLSSATPSTPDDPMHAILLRNEFMDGRYLPFEGTGAISNWSFSFSGDAAEYGKYVNEVDDIVLRLDYSAAWGGPAFTADVGAFFSGKTQQRPGYEVVGHAGKEKEVPEPPSTPATAPSAPGIPEPASSSPPPSGTPGATPQPAEPPPIALPPVPAMPDPDTTNIPVDFLSRFYALQTPESGGELAAGAEAALRTMFADGSYKSRPMTFLDQTFEVVEDSGDGQMIIRMRGHIDLTILGSYVSVEDKIVLMRKGGSYLVRSFN